MATLAPAAANDGCDYLIATAREELELVTAKLQEVLGPTEAVQSLATINEILRRAELAYDWGDEWPNHV